MSKKDVEAILLTTVFGWLVNAKWVKANRLRLIVRMWDLDLWGNVLRGGGHSQGS